MHVALLPGSASTVRADEQARAVQAEISMEHVVKPVENAFSTPRKRHHRDVCLAALGLVRCYDTAGPSGAARPS